MTRIRRILCASDFSKTSGKALISAIDLAKANRARLTIVHAHVPIVHRGWDARPARLFEVLPWECGRARHRDGTVSGHDRPRQEGHHRRPDSVALNGP